MQKPILIDFTIGIVIGLLIGMIIITIRLGPKLNNIKIQAIKHNAAKWQVSEQGDVKFEWIEKETK